MSLERLFEIVEGGVFKDIKGKRVYSGYDLKLLKTPQPILIPQNVDNLEEYILSQVKNEKIKPPRNANAYLLTGENEAISLECEGKKYKTYAISFFIRGIPSLPEKED